MTGDAAAVSLERAFGWILANRSRFALAGSDPGSAPFLEQLKRLSEYGLVCSFLRQRSMRYPSHAVLDTELEWIWTQLDGGQVLADTLTARPDLSPTIGHYAWMKPLGYSNRRLDHLAGYIAGSGLVEALPLLPWSRLSLCWALDQLGTPVTEATWRSCQQHGWIAQQGSPWVFSESIAYAITHELFYLTDWGASTSRLADRDRQYLESWMPVWIERAIELPDWDITAELLFAARLSNVSDNSEAMTRLLDAQLPDGSFHGPQRISTPDHTESDSSRDHEFDTHYHTTLAACLTTATAASEQA